MQRLVKLSSARCANALVRIPKVVINGSSPPLIMLSESAWSASTQTRAMLGNVVTGKGSTDDSARVLASLFALSATALVLFRTSSTDARCGTPNDLEKADAFFESRGSGGSLQLSLELLNQLYEGSGDRSELYFRLARTCYNLLSSTDPLDKPTSENKKALATEALKYAQEARKAAPQDFRSYYWCGIATQAYGDNVGGTKYTLERLNDIRADFEKAHKLNPTDGTTLYCLGAWCYSLSDLGWVSRKLAATLFATPPTSSFEEGLEFFLAAEKAEPNFWNKNPLMIAKSYEKLGDKASVMQWAKETIARPVVTVEDEQFKKEAEELLKRC